MAAVKEYHLQGKMSYQILLTALSGMQREAIHTLFRPKVGFPLVYHNLEM